MKKWFVILLIAFATPQLSAQTLHALLFVNEREPGREIDRAADMANMAKFFEGIAANLGYRYNLSRNSDPNFTAVRVNSVIDGLNVEEGDVVVFYFSGHGYNEGKNKWPTLNFKDRNYWVSDILARLNNKTGNAKLVLCIADCCNKGLDNSTLPPVTMNPISAKNVRDLFTGFDGKRTIIMSASKQGEYSWSDLREGAFFGICLRNAVNRHTDNSASNPTWEKVLNNATQMTEWVSQNRQTPQYDVIIKSPAFE